MEHINHTMADFAEPFRDAQPRPPAKEEGPILVFTADGKGVWLRNHGSRKDMVCLLHGERALWDMDEKEFSDAGGILDIFHVLECATLGQRTRSSMQNKPVPRSTA